ncbi:ferredoxin--NADP reductase [Streptomyces rubradiris]|uniref:ferredoxin--NADP reductase n=1 Tax=Streptomyces rubradiris TaxID=285531 RepID=UPI0033FADA86
MTTEQPRARGRDHGQAGTAATTVIVQRVVQETADAVSLVLRPEAGRRLAPLPGQFLTVRVPGGHARCYSFSRTGPEPTITVKRVPGGIGSNWLCDTATAGTRLTVLPPAGTFTPSSPDADLLLVAAGSGITPLLPMARSALERGTGRVVLLYANRNPGSVLFRDELRRLAAAHPARLLVHHLLSSVQGRARMEQLAQLVAPYAGREVFLCGPEGFMAAADDALRAQGAAGGRVRREVFVSLSGDVFAEAPAPPPPAGTGGPAPAPSGSGVDLVVDIDARSHALTWPAGTTLLDTLLAAEVDAPFSCREGSCGACACRVVRGEVDHGTGGVLTPEDRAEGYVLACRARPVDGGPPVHVSYD